jgi:hypothetical protein
MTAILVTVFLIIVCVQIGAGILKFENKREFEGTGFKKFTSDHEVSVARLHARTSTEENLGTTESMKQIIEHSYALRSTGQALLFAAVVLFPYHLTQMVMQRLEKRSPVANAAALDSESLS